MEEKCRCGNISRKVPCFERTGTELDCDDSCAIQFRNRQLADALGLDYKAHQAASGSHEYSDDLLDLYLVDADWGDSIEAKILEFMCTLSKRELRLPAMNSQKRMFVHLLAEEFGLQSHSVDSEPNRSVVVLKASSSAVPAARLRKYYVRRLK